MGEYLSSGAVVTVTFPNCWDCPDTAGHRPIFH